MFMYIYIIMFIFLLSFSTASKRLKNKERERDSERAAFNSCSARPSLAINLARRTDLKAFFYELPHCPYWRHFFTKFLGKK